MKETTRNFMVGLFVITSMGALGVLMVWFGETPTWLRTSDWELKILGVHDLRGVGEGSPVKLNGVEIGRVSELDFRDREHPEKGVVIIALISREYSIPSGAWAKVYGATLGIGSGLINIVVDEDAGTTSLPKENAVMRGEMTSMLNEIIPPSAIESFQRTVDEIGNVAAAATPVAENLELILEQRSVVDVDVPPGELGMMANVTTVIERMDSLMANLNTVLGDVNVQSDVKGVVRDLKTASEDIKAMIAIWKTKSSQLIDNANDAIDNTEVDIHKAFVSLDTILQDVNRSAGSISRIVNDIEEGRGTAGLISQDERLYESAVLAMSRLIEVLDNVATITGEIRDNGYVTISLASPVGPIPVKKIETPGGSKEDRAATSATP
ncbi:MAG: MlaD family protein [Planctomycetota bacterium]|jgi:ABC-type transporter Mla subunit MlaD